MDGMVYAEWSQCAIQYWQSMETKGKALMSPRHRLKLEGVSHHLILTQGSVHYLLLLLEHHTLALYSLQTLTIISSTKLHQAHTPYLLATDPHGNVLLVHSGGLSIWTFAQIKTGIQSMQKITMEWSTPPSRLLCMGREQYVAVCGARLKFVGAGKQEAQVEYGAQFGMKKAQVSFSTLSEESFFVLVPNTTHKFPFVFTPAQLNQWERAGFLRNYQEACLKYYMQDELLPKEECAMSLAADLKAVCVLTASEVFILEWRGGHGEIGVVLSVRMRVKAGSVSSPLGCHLNAGSGEVAFARNQRVGSVQPLEYSNARRTVKQPREGFFKEVYHTGRDIVLIGVGSPTKIYLISAQES